jgi:hypothetical protein
MKRIACSLWLVSFLPLTAFGAAPPRIDDPTEGQKLARELRTALPTEEVTFNGVMRISVPRAERRELPLQTRVVIEKDHWSSLYTTKSPGGETEMLTVRHSPEKANEYEWRHGDRVVKLTGFTGTNGFAGSDFALFDLGLEFYHWPTQLLATREMRKGRGCDVLESRPARTNAYSRVLSWIDQESRAQGQPGLLMAEAYDAQGAKLKEFEIKSFKNGQVADMEIRNLQTKTSTRLQFNLDK